MALLHVYLVLLFTAIGTDASIFTLRNNCNETIWPGILSGGGHPLPKNGGLQLKKNEMAEIDVPKGWSGRFWARNGCTFDQSGKGNCTTGDCGGLLQCAGSGGRPPASLAEFTLDSPFDFYDVSLVDGYNMPVSVIPSGGTGNCTEVKCIDDLNQKCPKDLEEKSNGIVVGCKSACFAFNKPEYCCTGTYNNPKICQPTNYSEVFKRVCPRAYSYPYDDATSTFTCKGANYSIIFC